MLLDASGRGGAALVDPDAAVRRAAGQVVVRRAGERYIGAGASVAGRVAALLLRPVVARDPASSRPARLAAVRSSLVPVLAKLLHHAPPAASAASAAASAAVRADALHALDEACQAAAKDEGDDLALVAEGAATPAASLMRNKEVEGQCVAALEALAQVTDGGLEGVLAFLQRELVAAEEELSRAADAPSACAGGAEDAAEREENSASVALPDLGEERNAQAPRKLPVASVGNVRELVRLCQRKLSLSRSAAAPVEEWHEGRGAAPVPPPTSTPLDRSPARPVATAASAALEAGESGLAQLSPVPSGPATLSLVQPYPLSALTAIAAADGDGCSRGRSRRSDQVPQARRLRRGGARSVPRPWNLRASLPPTWRARSRACTSPLHLRSTPRRADLRAPRRCGVAQKGKQPGKAKGTLSASAPIQGDGQYGVPRGDGPRAVLAVCST